MNFLRNNKERKNTSFHNYTNQKSLFNTSNSKYIPKTKITDSLAIHQLSSYIIMKYLNIILYFLFLYKINYYYEYKIMK